jgi:hypothetical protein
MKPKILKIGIIKLIKNQLKAGFFNACQKTEIKV